MVTLHEPIASVNLFDRFAAALDAAERALWPEGRVICPDCGTFGEMYLATAALEEEGRYVVPAPCGVCGGWTVEAEVTR